MFRKHTRYCIYRKDYTPESILAAYDLYEDLTDPGFWDKSLARYYLYLCGYPIYKCPGSSCRLCKEATAATQSVGVAWTRRITWWSIHPNMHLPS